MDEIFLQYVLSPFHTGEGLPKLCLQIFCRNDNHQLRPTALMQLLEDKVKYSALDQKILHWLNIATQQKLVELLPNNTLALDSYFGAQVLPILMATMHSHWLSTQNPILKEGMPRLARLEWEPMGAGLKKFRCMLSGQSAIIFKLNPYWYFDQRNWQFGMVETPLSYEVVQRLLSLPPLKDQQIKALYAALGATVHNSQPNPASASASEKILDDIALLPRLLLCLLPIQVPNPYDTEQFITIKLPAVQLICNYGGALVPFTQKSDVIEVKEGKKIRQLQRDVVAEKQMEVLVRESGLVSLSESGFKTLLDVKETSYFVLPSLEEDWLDYHLHQLPLFKEKNWQIIIEHDYPYQFAEETNLEWYTKFDEDVSHQWFDMELGIHVNGQKINLLPLIVKAIESYFASHENVISLPETGHLLTKLPDGRLFPIPMERLKPVLAVLTEIFDRQPINRQGKLRLSRVRAAQLLAVEKSIRNNLQMRWWGDEKLQQLATRLQNFNNLAMAPPPQGLCADLRNYQQDGLNWLQFLAEYQLGGILADDMGLGKTVQALAHLQLEKEKHSTIPPSLIVTPTTLITNWKLEAQKFCPQLKVLVLHGANRQDLFKKINEYDVILTTYPLIVRDHEVLEKYKFYLLILDEAQIIKNARSKAALFINKLNAKHRLCLSGTPLENHLGELWSLFNFLMPGFLGDRKHFSRFYKIPIERYANEEKRALLRERVAPFVLRRTKNSVSLELPPKNEITAMIELETQQRDLYESVRLALNEQVQLTVEKKGLYNSQLAVLDALLKLRQICCDPRLLKLESAKKSTAGSAKLEYLTQNLPMMIEEGRHILLFSQFTEMLGLIEEEVKQLGIPYVMLTGQTQDRQKPIDKFQRGEVPLFLISLKAGGLGLNLTTADTVIHYDPWWNPAVEKQATDRAHRIGQNKSVFVYKLIMAGTIEEKIVALQDQKQQLLDILHIDEQNISTKITVEQLKNILEFL